jgi:hypothetical protein
MTRLESTTPLVIAAAAIHSNRKSHGMRKATKVGPSEMKSGLMTNNNPGKKDLSGIKRKLND